MSVVHAQTIQMESTGRHMEIQAVLVVPTLTVQTTQMESTGRHMEERAAQAVRMQIVQIQTQESTGRHMEEHHRQDVTSEIVTTNQVLGVATLLMEVPVYLGAAGNVAPTTQRARTRDSVTQMTVKVTV